MRTCVRIRRCCTGAASRGEAGQSLPSSTLAHTREQSPQRTARRMDDDSAMAKTAA